METNFNEKQLHDIFFNMKRIEPAFNNWNDDELRNLTKAIYGCGYTWNQQDKDVGFFHPKNELILNFKGLHLYTPESIIEIYASTWSKDSAEKKMRGELRIKSFKSFWLWIISFSLLFFVDFKYAIFVILPLFIRFLYYTIKEYKIK
jgi:hypothetical protein